MSCGYLFDLIDFIKDGMFPARYRRASVAGNSVADSQPSSSMEETRQKSGYNTNPQKRIARHGSRNIRNTARPQQKEKKMYFYGALQAAIQ